MTNRKGSGSRAKQKPPGTRKSERRAPSDDETDKTSKGSSPPKRTRTEEETVMDASYTEQTTPTEQPSPPLPSEGTVDTTSQDEASATNTIDKGKDKEIPDPETLKDSIHAPNAEHTATQEATNESTESTK